jgi:superfamily II DNA or RNA helicase
VSGGSVARGGAVDYAAFLERKTHVGDQSGFKPLYMPEFLFPFQRSLVEWAVMKGRAAIFADCGLGKTPMQLVWAQNVVEKTCKPVLVLTPLAVGRQTVREAEKFGIEAKQSRDGKVAAPITVSNYEQLHKFDPNEFSGVVCDESSILKHFTGKTQKEVTRFMTKLPYRLLCTATAAPNDYTELGTSAEAIGELNYTEMLHRFFRQLDDKGQKQEMKKQANNERAAKHFQRLAFRVSQTISQWRLKNHAHDAFWKWVCSWAKACRKPSDLGFCDDGYNLPELIEREHVIQPRIAPDGYLFTLPAIGLQEERDERRRTMTERCELVADLVNHDRPAVVWCHMNNEGKALAKTIAGAREIAGATPDEEKEEIYEAFVTGELRVLVIKPKIGAWGLNWQHCNHVVTFASHSYEQFYQSLRRCYRFGQKKPVTLDVVYTEGETGVRRNMMRKQQQAETMFAELVRHMNAATKIERENRHTKPMELPNWI